MALYAVTDFSFYFLCCIVCFKFYVFYDLSDNIWKSIKFYCDGGSVIFKWRSAGNFELLFFYESLSCNFLCNTLILLICISI